MDKPLISIVTVCYNSARTIGDTLTSVDQQSFRNFEHLIIDGSSTDDTLEIILKAQSPLRRLKSEPDRGLYDAMNKGLKLAQGRYIIFLNSDDFFADPNVLNDVAIELVSQNPDILFGDIVYIDSVQSDIVTRWWKSGPFTSTKLNLGWHPPHPAFFARTDLLSNLGGFKLNFPIAADYDLMTSLLRQTTRITYIQRLITKMREGGQSNASLKNIMKANIECGLSAKRQGCIAWFLIPFLKPLSKVRQLIHPLNPLEG